MDAKTFDKSRLPSRHVTVGPQRAPHRSYYYAMGLTRDQIHQPFVGVATCWNEAAPCNIALMRQAQAVIATEGLQYTDRYQQAKCHPATVVEKDSRSQMLASFKVLNLDVEPLAKPGRPSTR